jgi:hypothetical protein
MKTKSPHRVSGPYTFENLCIFLLHGEDALPRGSYDVLQRAMDRKEAIVHETGTVGELLIENIGDIDLFIQSGEIVKGGRQDRVLGVDLIVGKKSGRVPIPSFCVEQSRWHKRGYESAAEFSSSPSYLASKSMKTSTKVHANQGKVWDSVSEEQTKLSAAVHASVQSDASPSSYQMTLEHEKVQDRVKGGLAKLRPLLCEHQDALGFAFSIQGELSSAEAYANHDLFSQLWEKLLIAAVTEAAAEFSVPRREGVKDPTTKDVETFLNIDPKDHPHERTISPRVLLREYKTTSKASFETADLEHGSACVHTSVLSR